MRPIPAPIQGKPINEFGYFTSPWVQWFNQTVYDNLSSVQASTTLPLMSTPLGSVGVSNFYAREDHQHPSDTSKLDAAGTAYDSDRLGGVEADLYALLEDIPYQPAFPNVPTQEPPFSKGVFVQNSTQTISNTTVETTVFGTGRGSRVFPANAWKTGAALRVKISGYISTDTPGGDATVRIKLGGVTLTTSLATLPSGISNEVFMIDFPIQCRSIGASGTFIGNGMTLIHGGIGLTTVSGRNLLMTAPATVNTTAATTLDVTYQWSTAAAGNAIVITNAEVILDYMR